MQPVFDCTPAATITALRYVDAPLTVRMRSGGASAVDAIRLLALGDPSKALDPAYGIYPEEMAPAVRALGARSAPTTSLDAIFGAAAAGHPVVASGNAVQLYDAGHGLSRPFVPHTIAIAARDDATRGAWLVSDPSKPTIQSIPEATIRAFLTDVPRGLGYAAPAPGSSTYTALVVEPVTHH